MCWRKKVHCGHFVNVSHKLSQGLSAKELLHNKSIHPRHGLYEIKHQAEVNAALNELVADNIWHTLTHLTAYDNRSATKDTGVETAKWLQAQFEAMARASGRTDTAHFLSKQAGISNLH